MCIEPLQYRGIALHLSLMTAFTALNFQLLRCSSSRSTQKAAAPIVTPMKTACKHPRVSVLQFCNCCTMRNPPMAVINCIPHWRHLVDMHVQ